VQWAPEDITFSILGFTTDQHARNVGQWAECQLGKRTISFFPLFTLNNPECQPRIPATLQLLAGLATRRPDRRYDILQFHRIEPVLYFLRSSAPKITFIHQNMDVLHNKSSDIRWKYAPWIYYRLEDLLIPRFDAVYVVHDEAVEAYRQRFTDISSRVNFLPTWMDPEIFYPASDAARRALRDDLCGRWEISTATKILVSVGRLDRQKDPGLLIDSFAIVANKEPSTHLVVIGDGVLRGVIKERIEYHSLAGRVTLVGLLLSSLVADWLRAAELLVLSSAYEGMPRCVVEALGCGLPVATTNVGAVKRIVRPGRNGEIADQHDPTSLSNAIEKCLVNVDHYRGEPCVRSVEGYTPENVLEPLYENYRRLASKNRP